MVLWLVVSVASALPGADGTAKLFADKGSTYFRSDKMKTVTVGAELAVVADAASTAAVGKAVVMEVNGKLARVSVDDDAAKAGGRFVVLPKPKPGAAVAAPAAKGPKLNGKLSTGPLQVFVSNHSDQSWTGCELEYADGSHYTLGEVVKHTDDTVMKLKFSSAAAPVYDHLVVSCVEGESRFYFSRPTAPQGSLKGYAVNDGGGSVIVFNNSETAWTACDVRKPDRTHFVLGTLKGHASDSINGGRFKKEAEASAGSWLELRCREGWLRQPL